MSIHAQAGSVDPGDLRTGGPVFLDWWLTNDSPFPTEDDFESHVYVDGVFIHSWVSTQSPPFQTFGISDWDGINENVRLDKGEHVFRLVVDALNQIPETDETDNVFERTFTWAGDPLVSTSDPRKGVNLAVRPANGRSDPIVVAAVDGATTSGPLTVDASTYVTWGARNDGLVSTDDTINVHVTFDGVVVDRRVVDGLSAFSGASLIDWDELTDRIAIAPGEHTLSVIVDPGNLIDETDETDNTYESVFTWESGAALPPPEATPIPAIEAPPYEELTRSNLESYVPADWDAPLVIRGTTLTPQITGRNGYVQAFAGAVVDYAITNDSPVSNPGDFSATLLVDAVPVDTSAFVAGSAGGIWLVDVAIPADRLTPGTHTVELQIDSKNEITEADESDNLVSLEFEAVAGAPPPPPDPVTYSDEQLQIMLSVVPELLLQVSDADELDSAGADWATEVITVADAAYFLATGAVLADERIDISLLSREAYDANNLAICLEYQDVLTATEYETTLSDCRSTVTSSAGLTWTGNGKVRVLVDSSTTPAAVLDTLLHELGHARQSLLAPTTRFTVQSEARSALLEAQAQVFSAVGLRHIEEFLGQNLTSYPDLAVIREDVNDSVDFHIDEAASAEEHSLGYELMWIGVLQNVGGLGLDEELRTNGVLSAASALAYYEYLLDIDGQDPVSWVNARLAAGSALIDEYRAIALARVVSELPARDEAHPHLQDVAFLAP